MASGDDGFLDALGDEGSDPVADKEKQQRAQQHAKRHRDAALDRLSINLDFLFEAHHFE